MCIIALKPEKVLFSREQLKTMWVHNPDGAGFMYAESGKVVVVKGLKNFDALCKAIDEAGPMRKMVLHFRIRTHGAASKELTHPFWIKQDELAMVHNGVIRAVTGETSETESDTSVFARKLAENYTDVGAAIGNKFHREMIEAYIGYSKLVFLDGSGKTFILNVHLGTWEGNIWYSNDSYKATTATKAEKFEKFDLTQFRASLQTVKPVPETVEFQIPAKGKGKGKGKGKVVPVPTLEPGRVVQKPLIGLQNHWDRIPDHSHKH